MTFESNKVHDTKRMWNGGPTRQFSLERGAASWTPYDGGGYAGQYICDDCGNPVVGLYKASHGMWRCADCRSKAKPLAPRGNAMGKTHISHVSTEAK